MLEDSLVKVQFVFCPDRAALLVLRGGKRQTVDGRWEMAAMKGLRERE
ncbi:MAG: hypothetical protein WBH57_04840 [Anaerolineae bacterium]